MGQFAEMILAGAKRSRGYAERILSGITPQIFARKPRFEGPGKTVVIETNHTAWAFGHLSLYPAFVLQMLGQSPGKVVPSPAFEALFKDGTPCQDDPDGKIYPAMETITTTYFRNYDAAFEIIAGLSDAALSAPSEEKARANWPLVGGRVNFMLNNHIMMHMGQLSAWRRCMGLPPA
jgi:hypothetical protein